MDLQGYKTALLITLGPLEFRRKEKSGAEKVLRQRLKFNKCEKETKPQIQEAEQTPHRIKLKKSAKTR